LPPEKKPEDFAVGHCPQRDRPGQVFETQRLQFIRTTTKCPANPQDSTGFSSKGVMIEQ